MPAITGTVEDLLESASRRGNIPLSQSTFLVPDMLAIANEELMAYALPVLHARRDDYYLEELEFDMSVPDTLIAGRHPAFRLPPWAMASTIRDVQAVSAGDSFYNLGRLMVDDVPNSMSQGWYFYGNYIVYQNNVVASTAPPVALRCIVHAKPNLLWRYQDAYPVDEEAGLTQAVRITGVTPGVADVEVDAAGITVHPNGGPISLISGKPGYEVKIRNVVGTIGTDIFTFDPIPEVMPEIGDYLCGADYTPVVPLPLEMHALLAQRMVVKFLEAQGDAEQMQQSRDSLQEMVMQIPLLLQPRAEGKPKKLANRVGLWRRWRW